MLGLIAFALLILACSYWRLSSHLDDGADRDSAAEKSGSSAKTPAVYEEKIVVIMAGDEKPTFLATPIANRAFSLGGENRNTQDEEKGSAEETKKKKERNANHEDSTTENTDNRNQ